MAPNIKFEGQWNGERLNYLRREAGLTTSKLAEITGINAKKLALYLNDKAEPTLNEAGILAAYFRTTIDDFMKPYPMDYKRTMEDYHNTKRHLYAMWLQGNEISTDFPGKPIAPWPYNLMDAITDGHWDDTLLPAQIDGIEYVLDNKLTEREARFVREYFRNTKTYMQIGSEANLSIERCRQITRKAIRKMRHPVNFKIIKHGINCNIFNQKEFEEKMNALNEREIELRKLETIVNERIEILHQLDEAMAVNTTNMHFIDNRIIPETPIDELEFSVRTYHCLRRYNITNLYELCMFLSTGCIWVIRNLGKKSINEITDKVKEAIDIDYSHLYTDIPIPNLNNINDAKAKMEDMRNQLKSQN